MQRQQPKEPVTSYLRCGRRLASSSKEELEEPWEFLWTLRRNWLELCNM